jgi:predicted RNA-binding Zn-ribbon protein involved in translation (DUF1610 family)
MTTVEDNYRAKALKLSPLDGGLAIVCPKCGHQMRLLGIEWETEDRDIYSFTCDLCGQSETRSVLTR